MNLQDLLDWNACINVLLAVMQGGQHALLQMLSWLGLTHDVDGQAAWPFATRLSGDVLLIDRGVARALLLALAAGALALLLVVSGLFVRRRWRLVAWGVAAALLWSAPWPDDGLLTSAATPASFHDSPSGFSDASIVRGERLYTQQCASCHGTNGRGDTTLGLSLSSAPPNLAGPLLWRRADGDLLWVVRHGKGAMPAFAQLTPDDAWALIDYMKANAAGTSLRETGTWQQPVRLPALSVDCSGGNSSNSSNSSPRMQDTRQWRGQRVRVLLARPGTANPLEDPRLQSLLLDPQHIVPVRSQPGLPAVACRNGDTQAWRALQIITGAPDGQMPGLELIADRDGWLRARKAAGDAAASWSDADMLCRSPLAATDATQASLAAQAIQASQATQEKLAGSAPADINTTPGAGAQQGLERLIAAMDAEPVRFIKGGFVH